MSGSVFCHLARERKNCNHRRKKSRQGKQNKPVPLLLPPPPPLPPLPQGLVPPLCTQYWFITHFYAGHRLWEQRNDWMRSWECRKRKMYNKNRPLVNQKRNICFNGTGINHQKRPCHTVDCDIHVHFVFMIIETSPYFHACSHFIHVHTWTLFVREKIMNCGLWKWL